MKEHLYRFVIKEHTHTLHLPVNLDEPLMEQLTSEHLVEVVLPDGRRAYEWRVGVDPHLGDCTKLGETFRFTLTPNVLVRFRELQDAARETLLESLAA